MDNARHWPEFLSDSASQSAALNNPDNGLLPLADSESILEVHGLVAGYGSRRVLHNIYCHFPRNSITAIMGPSGCGKSTFVKSLNRTLELTPGATVDGGTVLFHGQNVYESARDPMEVRKRIGIIHQKPVPFPMSILENVLFGARFHRQLNGVRPREYAERFLDRVGLLDEVKDRLEEPASRLSGGQQQRLCLARTLANQPEVILMDEPCSAIDPMATQRIELLIAELSKDFTIVIVTHNLQQARRVADAALLMVDGHVIEAGVAAEMFNKPRTKLGRDFIEGAIG